MIARGGRRVPSNDPGHGANVNAGFPAFVRMAALAVLLLPAAASRAAPEALVDDYMRKSGLVEQIAQIAGGVLVGIEQAQARPQAPRLSGEQLDRLRRAVKAAFGADRLRNALRSELVATLPAADTEQVLEWLDTPFGKRVTAIEEAGSTPEAYQRRTEVAARTFAALSPARRAELERMMRASGAVEVYASITLNQQIGIIRGMALSAGLPDTVPSEEAKAKLELYRSQIAAAAGPTLLANAAVLYGPLSDTELRDYALTLELPSSRRVTEATGAALDKVLSAAALDLGRRIGDSTKPAPATTSRPAPGRTRFQRFFGGGRLKRRRKTPLCVCY